MKSQLTVGKKLMISFGVMLAFTLGLALSSLTSIGSLGNEMIIADTVYAKKIDLIGQIDSTVADLRTGQRGMVLFSILKDPVRSEAGNQQYLTGVAGVEKLVAELRPMLLTDRAKQALDQVQSGLASWQPIYQEIRQHCANQQFGDELRTALDRSGKLAEEMNKAAEDIQEAQRGLSAKQAQAARDQVSSSRWIAIGLIALCFMVGAGVVWIVRQISGALRQIAGEMAEGADQVADAAAQVASSSQSLAQGSSEQAASLEETSASSEEINSMARKNAENSKFAADNMVEAEQRVTEANGHLEQMVVSMGEINASSDKISKIIKVIDEIAFQTNILALNAAVEAARAGEAGMGFAVVADEVRNLAQRCAQAAKDTSGLIEESIDKSSDGKNKLELVATAVRSITESAAKVKTLVDEVKLGSDEQARGIDQVSKAIVQMESVTQTTAASAEESASASEELSAQSDTLKSIAARLNGMVGGGSASEGVRLDRSASHGNSKTERSGANSALASLHKAVSKKQGAGRQPAVATARAEHGKFPMEEEFKEF